MLKLNEWLQAVATDNGLLPELLKREKTPVRKRKRQRATLEEAEHPEREQDRTGRK